MQEGWRCLSCGSWASMAALESGGAFQLTCSPLPTRINALAIWDCVQVLPDFSVLEINGRRSHPSHKHKLRLLNGLFFCCACGKLGNEQLKGLLTACSPLPHGLSQAYSYGNRNLRALERHRLPRDLTQWPVDELCTSTSRCTPSLAFVPSTLYVVGAPSVVSSTTSQSRCTDTATPLWQIS